MKYVCLSTYETPKMHAAYIYRYGCCCYAQHHFATKTEDSTQFIFTYLWFNSIKPVSISTEYHCSY
jgi:hypothetical protein